MLKRVVLQPKLMVHKRYVPTLAACSDRKDITKVISERQREMELTVTGHTRPSQRWNYFSFDGMFSGSASRSLPEWLFFNHTIKHDQKWRTVTMYDCSKDGGVWVYIP